MLSDQVPNPTIMQVCSTLILPVFLQKIKGHLLMCLFVRIRKSSDFLRTLRQRSELNWYTETESIIGPYNRGEARESWLQASSQQALGSWINPWVTTPQALKE